jgi:hypothetical protein
MAVIVMTVYSDRDLDPRDVQCLGIHQDDLARLRKGWNGNQPDRLPVWSVNQPCPKLGLGPDKVEVRTLLHDKGLVVLEGVGPWFGSVSRLMG